MCVCVPVCIYIYIYLNSVRSAHSRDGSGSVDCKEEIKQVDMLRLELAVKG